ncbi:GPP34 family phosphoprotein [Planosporangium sp. 12N6]|uniref:GPP34 family phosphoprotein n=1 Tax=Planosporangium spinosum TaxID=3402278 RepID=UPI003CEE0A67
MQPQAELAVADSFWLLNYDDNPRRASLADRMLDAGLAGAVLAELIIDGQLVLLEGNSTVMTNPTRLPPKDEVAALVMGYITRDPTPHTVRRWVADLAGIVTPAICERLAKTGYAHLTGNRLTGRRYVPQSANVAAGPGVRLRYHMSHPGQVQSWNVLVLAGLVLVTGMVAVVARESQQVATEQLRALAGRLPPVILSVLAAVEAEIVSAPLRPNR